MPGVGPEDVLIRVEAAGINFADTVRRRGLHYPVPTPLPFIPGGEVVGIIEAIGVDVDDRQVGERVFGNPGAGGSAEYVAVPRRNVFAFPDELDPVTGIALLIQGLTAALTLRESARMQPVESVFVQAAAGGVGSLAVQLARLDGAGMVIAGASSPEKRAFATDLGANVVVDYTVPGWAADIRDATGGRGVDVILEMSGGAVFLESLECLAPFGRSIIYGNASGRPEPIPPQRLLSKNQSLVGFYLGGFLGRRALIESTLGDLARHVAAGRLMVQSGGTFALEQVAEAHRQLEARVATGKLVLRP